MIVGYTKGNGTATDSTCEASSITYWTTIYVANDEPIKNVMFFEKPLVLISGKIRQLWVDYYNRHIPWNAPIIVHKSGLLTDKRFRRRFQGFNKGRHWDRKRK